MELLKNIEVRGFRSIAEVKLQNLSHTNALIGRNSSGKSNILRALNLFFNDQTDPGTTLAFDSDLHTPLRRSKKRRQIVVKVEFEPGSGFKIHRNIPAAKIRNIPRFSIQRTWGLDRQRKPTTSTDLLVDDAIVPDRGDVASAVLRLVTFRYLPNRTSPTDLLREESPAITRALARRLADVATGSLIESTNRAATRLLADADQSMRVAGAPFQELQLDTPASIAELLQVRGFRALDNFGSVISSDAWGYGHQAFFSYHVLKDADTDYSQSFGWRQATIWAIEEPEAGLHRDLESALARTLDDWTKNEANRLQLFYTSHSATFAQRSSRGYWLKLEESGTSANLEEAPRLQARAQREGVSHASDPFLAFQDRPLVVVEGTHDVEALNHAASVFGIVTLRFVTPKMVDPAAPSDGLSGIEATLRSSTTARSLRDTRAPVVVLVDWEVSDNELSSVRKAYGTGGARFVIRADAGLCNPQLGEDFRGIERFYPRSVLDLAERADEIQLGRHATRPWSVSRAQLAQAKGSLVRRLIQVADSAELSHLRGLVAQVERTADRAADSYVVLFKNGDVCRAPTPPSAAQLRKRRDLIVDVIGGRNDRYAIAFTKRGKNHTVPIGSLPQSRGVVAPVTREDSSDQVIGFFSSDPRSTGEFQYEKPALGKEYEEPYPHFVAITRRGLAARLTLWPFVTSTNAASRSYLRLEDGDEVVGILKVYADDDVGLINSEGVARRVNAMDLPLRVRAARPNPVLTDTGHPIICGFVVSEETQLLTRSGAPRSCPTISTLASNVSVPDIVHVGRPVRIPKLD